MPVEYPRDPRTGKVVVKGSLGSGQAVVPEKPPAPKPKPKPASKPKAKPQGFQVFGFGPQGFSLNKLANDLTYEVKSGRAARTALPMLSTATNPALILGATTAVTNVGRNVIEARQKLSGRPKADYTTSPAGRALDQVEGRVYTSLGSKDPAQMTPQEKGLRDLGGSLALTAFAGIATGPALSALSNAKYVGPAFQALKDTIDVSKATTIWGKAGRLITDAAVGEVATTPFDDNTGGSALGFVDLLLRWKPVKGLVGDVAPLDPVKPGMDRIEAATAAFLPNFGAGLALGGALVLGPSLPSLLGRVPATTRARNAQRTIEPIRTARTDLEGAGMTQSSPETGAGAFTPDAMDPKSPLAQANAELEAKYGIAPAEPKAEPEPAPAPTPVVDGEPAPAASSVDLDQWEVDYDPSLPEADVALSLIRNSSDAELLESIRSGGSVLEVLDEKMATRAPAGPDPTLSMELNAAPTERLAEPITPFVDQWKRLGQKDPQQFLATFHPDVNPDLAARAKAMFGRDWEQLTVDDGVAVLQAAADDGTTVIPNRLLPGQQIMKVPDIKVDPQRFQYKGGVDARGVQRGSSLEGVDRWNTDMENVVEVWQDPADGAYYIVNGHNRLAKAKELGINTLVVKEIIADTAEQAKTAGALSNIASGGGKPIDAARFMKGAGVKDPAQLEAMGVPLSPDSGHGLSGFQLSQLPEDVLQAVESGQIKERMGRIIGGSGADEESMRAAYRYLVENPGTTEGRMKGMLELSKQMGGGPTKAARAEQADLLKGTDWDQTFNQQMIAVADLADEVSTLLKREKKLFTMADANSAALEAKGSRIDKASAQQVADANARAIDFFQRTWMETGPIRDLLNEGGARVAAGENKAAVAKQIKNRLVGQLGDLMGEEAVTRTDVVQEDLLAQAPQQLDELMPEDRPAMEMLAIQRAIQNGEVRPPETPIPELPTDSGVDLMKAQRDIEANTITDDVVRAMDDELALREQFSELDDAVVRETEKAARDQMGYDLMTFEEKKAAGLVDVVEDAGFRQLEPPSPDDMLKRYGSAANIAKERAAREKLATDIIRKVAGNEVAIRFEDVYLRAPQKAQHGGDGKQMGLQMGLYRAQQDLIIVRGVLEQEYRSGVAAAAYHESFHRIQWASLGEKDARILDGRIARLRSAIFSGTRKGNLRTGKPKAYSETTAIALERYAPAKDLGLDPVQAVFGVQVLDAADELFGSKIAQSNSVETLAEAVGGVFSAFDKILAYIERMHNLVTIGVFEDYFDVLERARTGRLNLDSEELVLPDGNINPLSGYGRMIDPNGWRQRSWNGKKIENAGLSLSSEGAVVDDFSKILGDIDPKTGFPKGVSKAAAKAALNGNPTRALAESVQLAETRLTDINARIEAVKQRAAQEGC